MEHTSNYNLSQWAGEDRILREDFNADNAKIEAALTNAGNCRIAVGSYVGTGKSGASNPTVLQFDFQPKVIFLDCRTKHSYNTIPMYYILFSGFSELACPSSGNSNTVTWGSDGSVSWYSESAGAQFNSNGTTYHYIAIG